MLYVWIPCFKLKNNVQLNKFDYFIAGLKSLNLQKIDSSSIYYI